MSLNFFCISAYNNDLSWLEEYPNPHLIYDKVWAGGWADNDQSKLLPPSNLREKHPEYNITYGDPNGYNISDYMTFIIDHYDNLPDVTCFLKGNTIGRHVRKEVFDRIIDNKYFTTIEDWKVHNPEQESLKEEYAMLSCEGGWMESNNSWYLNHSKHPIKYFTYYNDFLDYCFEDPCHPKYIRFPPGGNYIVPKEHILKYPKNFYKNLRTFARHTRVSGEGQLIERALYTIWMSNFKVSENMCKNHGDEIFTRPRVTKSLLRSRRIT